MISSVNLSMRFIKYFINFKNTVVPDQYTILHFQITLIINGKVIFSKNFNNLFRSVLDVDVYSAGLAEYHVKDGFVGRTFGAVLGEQYRRTKFGDRYWFEHGGQTGSFSIGKSHF